MGLIFGEEKSSALHDSKTGGCMYTEYFKLSEPPFSLTPDPRYLFMSARHREGLAHLLYGVQQPGGFVQLTGDIGSGKTTLCRCLIKQLPPEADVALILNPRLTVIELLATICDELRIPYPADTQSNKVLIDALNERLLAAHAVRRRTILIIDEAQNLHSDVLEQIRLLTNLETAKEKLLQIILIGQPELLSILKGKKLRQLAQRITARYHLLALSRQETYAYIQHRVRVAGRRDPLFTRPALRCVYGLSRGMPRVINIICDRALLGAYAFDKRRVTASIVRRAGRETRGRIAGYSRIRIEWKTGVPVLAILALLFIAGAIWLSPFGQNLLHHDNTAIPAAIPASAKQQSPGPASPAANLSSLPAGKDSSFAEATATGTPDAVKSMDDPGRRSDGNPSLSSEATRPRLLRILSDPALKGSALAGFANLYALWGVRPLLNASESGCKAGAAYGLECLFQTGNWPKLRRFDLPALLELVTPAGARYRATLVQLGSETATLAIGGRQYAFPLAEIDQVWDGAFILLWKPPFTMREVSLGARGEEVLWLRRALDRLEGKKSTDAVSDIFDDSLRQRILAFQRERSLIPDGYVGSETLVRLSLASDGANAPSISRHERQ